MLKLFIILLLYTIAAACQNIDSVSAKKFIHHLCNNDLPDSLIEVETLNAVNRLGIKYDNVYCKALISYDLPDEIKSYYKNQSSDLSYKIEPVSESLDRLVVSSASKKFSTKFYFKNAKLIHPVFAETNNWQVLNSKYSRLFYSDSSSLNQYAVHKLDNFVERIGKLFGFSDSDFMLLEIEKIYYVLCNSEDEIKRLTGYYTRGMYNLSGDMILSTYNSHYHELVHFLVNYKLKTLPLYTHSFLQEGIAVALGGRGGLSAGSLLNIATFLEQSQFFNYREILKNSEFKMHDASITYPVSGLYNLFLMEQFGMEEYINLYLKYSGSENEINQMTIQQEELPDENRWKQFSSEYKNSVIIDSSISQSGVELKQGYYHCKINEPVFFYSKAKSDGYISKLFLELFPGRNYSGEKYGVVPKENEITVYNFFTNTIEASYSSGFSMEQKKIKDENGYWCFKIDAAVFDDILLP
ncbi:MAG: hypothetical protein IPM56_17125 [Ignavibacteriales bacterium]|nr:MAG: hypothetical protein IPM56_17125 [Ignavibacteriales bacterium]